LNKLRSTGTPEAFAHFQAGLSDTLRDEYRKVRKEGREPTKADLPQKIQNKVSAAFGYDRAAADDFFSKVKAEETISNRTQDILNKIKREGSISNNDKRQLHMVVESIGHAIAMPLATHFGKLGIGLYGSYWLLKGARQLYNMLTTGGGLAPRRYGREITNALLNPNAKLATSGNGLLAMPARSATSQARINSISNALVPAGVMSAASANQGASP